MNKSITQDNQNDKQISTSIRRFFTRFHVSSALKAANAYKKKGVPVMEIYRFMKMIQINWIRFTTILAGRIIKEAIRPLDSEERVNVLIIDDSMYERNRSKKVELLTKVYDHAKHAYKFGFRMLFSI